MDLIDAKAWKLDLLLLHGSNEKTAWIIDRINHAHLKGFESAAEREELVQTIQRKMEEYYR